MLWLGLLILLFSEALTRESGPVLVWGNYGAKNLGSLPNHQSSLQFAQTLQKLLATRPVILLFTEHSLSVEDFNNREAIGSQQAYPYLFNLSHTPGFQYLPSVEGAVSVLHQLTHHGYSLAQYDEESPPSVSVPTILVGRLQEPTAEQSRQSLLREHDQHMYELTQDALQRYGQVLVLYTGRHASYVLPNRHKREVDEEEAGPLEIVMNDKDPDKKVYVVTGSPIEYRKGDQIYNLSDIIYTSKETNKKNFITLDVKFKQEAMAISLDWVFKSPSDLSGWSLEAVKIEGTDDVEMKIKSGEQISAPGGYSYYCAKEIVFSGVDKEGITHTLTLQGIQTQPRLNGQMFGPAAHCVPYFSQPIWTGLLVSAFLLSIATVAILLLLDIRTNDRFDDPKGKCLTITNVE